MKHEKIIKRENGDSVMITARVYVDSYIDEVNYSSGVAIKAKGKRNWLNVSDGVTAEEIHSAKMELWEKLKP